jgi:hypothetical protein
MPTTNKYDYEKDVPTAVAVAVVKNNDPYHWLWFGLSFVVSSLLVFTIIYTTTGWSSRPMIHVRISPLQLTNKKMLASPSDSISDVAMMHKNKKVFAFSPTMVMIPTKLSTFAPLEADQSLVTTHSVVLSLQQLVREYRLALQQQRSRNHIFEGPLQVLKSVGKVVKQGVWKFLKKLIERL